MLAVSLDESKGRTTGTSHSTTAICTTSTLPSFSVSVLISASLRVLSISVTTSTLLSFSISDKRLLAVVDHVRRWLFSKGANETPAKPETRVSGEDTIGAPPQPGEGA
jgi:hypothetical protein